MKKVLIAICVALLAILIVNVDKIKRLESERDKYKTNTRTLLADIDYYKTNEGLNAASVGVLELKLSEYKKYREDDLSLINSLRTDKRDLQAVTTVQTQTIKELRGSVRDSIVYLPGDSIITILRCVDIRDQWFELHGCARPDNTFSGIYINRDSLLVASTVKYKRFLGFLWKTNKVKERKVDAVSKNPATKILGIEYIEIER